MIKSGLSMQLYGLTRKVKQNTKFRKVNLKTNSKEIKLLNLKQEFIKFISMVQLTLPKGSNVSKGKTFGSDGKNKIVPTFTDGIENLVKIQG